MQNLATDIRGFIVCQEHVAGRDRLDMKWQFATYRAGVSLWSQNVRFAPQKQTSDDGVECPLRAISRHSLAIRPSTAATHGRLPWGARLAWKLNSKKF